MKFRLRAGQRSGKYRSGQLVSASYAARYPHKVSRVRKKTRVRKPAPPKKRLPPEPLETPDWDISVRYGDDA